MLHRILAIALCALGQPTSATLVSPTSAPASAIAASRGRIFVGDMMTSGFVYSMVLPMVAHRNLPLGTLVEVRANGRSVRGIVMDNFIHFRHVDVELSPVLSRRLGLLPDGFQPVTLVVMGCEPRSRWIHAIGALTP